MRTRVTLHAYAGAVVSYRKPWRLPAAYSPDIQVVAARCRAAGGEEAAIALLPEVFAAGLSDAALTRRVARPGGGPRHHPGRGRDRARAPGSVQAYRLLLRGDEGGRSHCRLCPAGANANGWKNARDVLRHLRRDHFGLTRGCPKW